MTSIKAEVTGVSIKAAADGRLTSGMVGVPVSITFDSAWDGLTKTAVFRAGELARSVKYAGVSVAVPWEVMRKAGQVLFIGVEGRNSDGTLVMPTAWAQVGVIERGASAEAPAAGAVVSGSRADGITPHIGENGNWFIGETDTGVAAGGVKTVNGKEPDEKGNVEITIPDSGQNAVLYEVQELTDEQKAQARKNIGAITTDDVVNALSGGMNLLSDATWEIGYFYTTGGNTTEQNDYYAYQYRTVEPIPVTPGTSFKYTLKLPYPRDASTGLTTGSDTDGAVVFGEYDSSGAWVQRVVHMQSGGTVSGGYEYFEGEYQASENAHGLRVYIRTYKQVPSEIFALYVGDVSGGMRILPEATEANNGKVPVVSGEQYVLVELPSTTETPEIVGASVGEKAMEFSYLMHGTDKVESFIFFADPHFLNSINNESQMREYLDTLKLYHDVTPTSFVIGGGDWYGNSDTYETACFKLGYIDGWMRRLFGDRHYPAVGNHDTNQQGKDETGGTWTGILSKETVRNLWFREQGNTYYAFDGANTKFYVLDTWKEGTDAAYYWEQIAWLGGKLKQDDPENTALILHIGYSVSGDSYAINSLATNALALCEAFNNATSITLNGATYDFTGCAGKVRFALSGHIHADYATIVNGIPLIATTHMRDGNTPTFDLCLADYSANKLHLVRVGTGESRQFTMGPDGAILDGAEDNPPEEEVPSLPVTFSVADPIVFLNHCNHNGGGINYYDKTVRALIATTDNTGAPYSVGTGSTDTTHYALKVPEGATTITFNCGSTLKWSYESMNETGGKVDAVGYWSDNGATEVIPSGEYYLVKFKKADESAFEADYDYSGITWTFN